MKSLLPPQPIDVSSWVLSRRPLYDEKVTLKIDYYTHIEAIIEAIHEPVLILDKELIIHSANKAFLEKFKVTKKSILGKPLFINSNTNAQSKKLIRQLKKLREPNTSFNELELTYPFRKIGERTLLINAKQIAYEKKHPPIILVSIEDVTERKYIERQKDDFVGYVTHELKTPLTSLSTFIQLLQGYHTKTGDKKSQFLLAKAAGQLDRLTNLLSSFSQVYKAQTGMLELHKENTDLYELCRETVEMFQYTTTSHTISIEGNVTKPISIDRERIRQVIINLLINAIKYSPDADAIVVKFREDAKSIIVSVQDFGVGIPKDSQTKIFERFFRVKDKQSYNAKGLGLGLYIALAIVEAHKGKLWVTSEEGKGSTFSFSLPTKS